MICRRITITNQPGDSEEYKRTLPPLVISPNDMIGDAMKVSKLKELILSQLIKFGYTSTVNDFTLMVSGGMSLSNDDLLEKDYVEGTYMLYGQENINPIRIVSSQRNRPGFVASIIPRFEIVLASLEQYWETQDKTMKPQYYKKYAVFFRGLVAKVLKHKIDLKVFYAANPNN